MHLLVNWRRPNQIPHLRRAPDQGVVGLHDDIAFGRGPHARLKSLSWSPWSSSFEVTGGWGIFGAVPVGPAQRGPSQSADHGFLWHVDGARRSQSQRCRRPAMWSQ